MTTFLNYFYGLRLDFIAKSVVFYSLIYLCIRMRFQHNRCFRWGVGFTLMLWAAATLWTTTFGRYPGQVHPPMLVPFHSYRELFETGMTEIFRSNFMNVVLFYPAGILTASLLPEKWSCGQKLLSVLILFALLSSTIEYVQFSCTLGEPEIDDVIHNALGAVLGSLPILCQNVLSKPAQ